MLQKELYKVTYRSTALCNPRQVSGTRPVRSLRNSHLRTCKAVNTISKDLVEGKASQKQKMYANSVLE